LPRFPRHDRLFRALLRLFPSEFRGDFGEEMTADFDDQRRDATGKPSEMRRLWIRTVVDLLGRAPREHVDVLWRDVVHAGRILRRHPASTATAVVSLALGIGLNSAVFSVVNGVLWRDLPLPESDRLVLVSAVSPGEAQHGVPPAAVLDVEREAKTLDRIGAGALRFLTVVEPNPVRIACLAVSDGFFDVFGREPVLGRRFNQADYDPSLAHWTQLREPRALPAPRVVVMGYQLWQRRFLGDPGVIGRRLTLTGGDSVEIIGVMGPELDSLADAIPGQCWLPEALDPTGWAGIGSVVGRLAPGVSLEQAETELDVIGRRVLRSTTEEPRTLRPRLMLDQIVSSVRTQLTLLFGAVVCVLLVTCANVMSLFLAHASGRRDELSTRVALGATRLHLVRQTLTESLLISFIGGACGFLLAVWAVPTLVAMAPANVPRLAQIGVDWFTFAFTAIVSLAVGTICGLLAALPACPSASTLVGAGRVTAPRRTSRFREGLIVCEIALALMLVVAAMLMVRTVRALGDIDLGFDPTHVVAADLSSTVRPGGPFTDGRQLQMAVVERVKALPGVRAVGIGLGPLFGGMGLGGLIVPGDPRDFGTVGVDAVSPGYFEALGARLLAGRFFEARDAIAGAPSVILVNEAAARTFWRGANPIGKVVVISKTTELRVVGVVANLRASTLEQEPGPTMYQLSVQSRNFGANSMLIRVDGDPQALVPAIRSIVRSLDPEQPFAGVTPLQARLDRAMAPRRFVLRLVGLFSALGLILAVVGIYGVLAESVAQRVPEIGVRRAFGATAADVLVLFLRYGARLVCIGLIVGIVGAVLLRDSMSTIIYGVQTLDPLSFLAACVSLLMATLAASALPARRAADLDPAVALRSE
jgi:putative ABC transport system permease protein